MNSYDLSRQFWEFSFEHPTKIRPIHCAIYFFAVEHCNRLNWKREFGLPTSTVIESIGVKSYRSYKTAFDELVEWGLFILIQHAKNQYCSNIVAFVLKDKAKYKAKAITGTKQSTKQGQYNKTIQTIQTVKTIKQDLQKQNFSGGDTRRNKTVKELLDGK